MEEKILPIGIDSELEHVKSEIDRIDALFTVATGPMGHQEVNYHIITEERDHRTIQQLLPHIASINESSKENILFKSPSSPPQYRDTIEVFHSEISNKTKDDLQQDRVSYDDYNRKARYSLPEIDSSNQQENKHQTKKGNSPFKHFRKQQPRSSPIPTINEHGFPLPSFDQSLIEIPERCRPTVNNLLQDQAKNLLPFYTLNELAQHNDLTDAWICIFGSIYDITSLIKSTQNSSTFQQFINHAGQDMSSFFNQQTHQPRMRIDSRTHEPISLIKNLAFVPPFWQTNDYLTGRLTEHSRYIRLRHNFSPTHPYLLEVAEEETIGQIAIKFLKYNSHIFSYIWRYNDQTLDFNKTLTENGIPNEETFHDKYGWRSDNDNCPTILLYFCDDLTIA